MNYQIDGPELGIGFKTLRRDEQESTVGVLLDTGVHNRMLARGDTELTEVDPRGEIAHLPRIAAPHASIRLSTGRRAIRLAIHSDPVLYAWERESS